MAKIDGRIVVSLAIPRIPLADLSENYRSTADTMIELIADAATIQVWAHSQTATEFYLGSF